MSWPLTPCSTCPRVTLGLPLPCLSQLTRSRTLCARADKNGLQYREDNYNQVCHVDKNSPKPAMEFREQEPGVPSKELIEKSNQFAFKSVEEINEYNGIRSKNIGKIIKLVQECKSRSTKRLRKGENGEQKFVHIIKNDDGSEVEYSDCGCGMNYCTAGKGRGDGMVSTTECQECVMQSGLVELEPPKKNPGFGDSFQAPESSEMS